MLIEQYPYIDEQGNEHENLVKHYSDEDILILQVETGVKYSDAVDVYPCRYTYKETDEPIDLAEGRCTGGRKT